MKKEPITEPETLRRGKKSKREGKPMKTGNKAEDIKKEQGTAAENDCPFTPEELAEAKSIEELFCLERVVPNG